MTSVMVSFLIGAVAGFILGALVMRNNYKRAKEIEDKFRGVKV